MIAGVCVVAWQLSVASQTPLYVAWEAARNTPSSVKGDRIFHTLNWVSTVPLTLTPFAAAACYAKVSPSMKYDIAILRQTILELRSLLLLSGAVLCVAVIEIYLGFHWTSSSLDNHWRSVVLDMGASAAFLVGGFYSLFLVVSIGPYFWWLSQASNALAVDTLGVADDVPTVTDWMRRRGILIDARTEITRLMAVIGPVATGFALPILKGMVGE